MRIEPHGRVALLHLEHGKANAIGPSFLDGLSRLIDELEASDARAAVITGSGTIFSAGLDLPSLVALDRPGVESFIGRFSDVMLRVFALRLPLVAAVNGHAIAGGCVLAMQADWRIMTGRACKIGLNEVALGIGLPAVVTETLRGQVPAATLVPAILEGKLFTPEEALAAGLVHTLVPHDSVLDAALLRAQVLADVAPIAFAHAKASIREPIARTIRAAHADGDARRWTETWMSPDGQKGIQAAVARLSQR